MRSGAMFPQELLLSHLTMVFDAGQALSRATSRRPADGNHVSRWPGIHQRQQLLD